MVVGERIKARDTTCFPQIYMLPIIPIYQCHKPHYSNTMWASNIYEQLLFEITHFIIPTNDYSKNMENKKLARTHDLPYGLS